MGNDSWIIHLRHGGWCSTSAGCHAFTSTDVGSSRFTVDPSSPSFNSSRFGLNWFQGLLSANRSVNPAFYSFNVAELLYCDGGLYAGTAGRLPVLGSADQFIHSEGDKIWKAIFQGGWTGSAACGQRNTKEPAALPCCAVPWCAVPCCAMLCCAVLCCAVLCWCPPGSLLCIC